MKLTPAANQLGKFALVGFSALALAACDSSSNDSAVQPSANPNACAAGVTSPMVAMAAKIEQTGVIQVRSQSDGTLHCSLPATTTDTRVTTNGSDIYQIGRYQQDFLAKFSLDDVQTAAYQYSVNGTDTAANPYQVVFVSDNKAYVVRRGGTEVWIIDPAATSEANFKIGKLDLSAYGDAYPPHATAAELVDGKLFVMMERLSGPSGYSPIESGYVAVFDTSTDTEIDTGMGTADGLLGIKLNVTNPTAFQYEEENGLLYLVGRGNIYNNSDVSGDPYQGGVVTIDPENYTASMLLDDGTETENRDFFTGLQVVSASKAYLQTYAGWQDTTLYTFNATTGVVDADPVANMSNVDITTMAEGPEGGLWLGINHATEEPKVEILDTANDTTLRSFNTEMVPLNFSFIEQEAE